MLLAILAAPIAGVSCAYLIGFGTGSPELALPYALSLVLLLALATARSLSA